MVLERPARQVEFVHVAAIEAFPVVRVIAVDEQGDRTGILQGDADEERIRDPQPECRQEKSCNER